MLAGGRGRILTSALLVGLVMLGRAFSVRVCHVYDDAFITYRYAANLAAGQGLVYHPGAAWEPVLGTTTPGYAVWLAGWIALGFDGLQTALISNALFDGVSAVLLFALMPGRRLAAAAALIAFAGLPELARISAGGMEGSALVCTSLAAILCLRRGAALAAALLAAVACTMRPEAVLLVAILAFFAHQKRQLASFLLPVLVLGLVYAGTLTWVYGSPIPQSISAKASRHSGATTLDTWLEIGRQAWLPSLMYLPLLPVVVYGTARGLRRGEALAPLLLFSLAITASYLLARPHTWGWYYYLPLTAWAVGLGLGVDGLAKRLVRAELWREQLLPVAAVPLAAVALLFGTRGRVDAVTERVYEPLAEWAREVELESSAVRVLASDIGALGYYGRGQVLDSEGLVWPQAVAAGGSQPELVREHRPEYLMITAVRPKVQPLMEDETIASMYVPVRRFSARGETGLEVEPASLPENWVQDYLVYERRDR